MRRNALIIGYLVTVVVVAVTLELVGRHRRAPVLGATLGEVVQPALPVPVSPSTPPPPAAVIPPPEEPAVEPVPQNRPVADRPSRRRRH